MFENVGGGETRQRAAVPSAPGAPSAPRSSVGQLQQILTFLSAVDPTDLPAELALDETRELLAARAQFDALVLRRLGDVDTRELHRLDASPTTTAWVRAQGAEVDP